MKTRLFTGILLLTGGWFFSQATLGQGVVASYAEHESVSTSDDNDTSEVGGLEGMMSFNVNGVTFNMVFVEGGSFEMGATPEQSNGYTPESDERPVHQVTLNNFYILVKPRLPRSCGSQ